MKKIKKVLSAVLAATMVMSLVACSNETGTEKEAETASEATETEGAEQTAASDVKVGFIFLHDENSTYDLNFINGATEACKAAGVEYMFKTNIPEGQECYEAACELADAGCDIV